MLLKVCVNGARRPAEHAALPTSPARIAAEVAAAVAAGAGAAHVHVKDAAGADTLDGAALAEVLTAVRAAAPGCPVGVTTGAWALPDPVERVAAIGSWSVLPDFASVNWHEDGADDVAAALLGRGVGVEAGLWHAEGVERWLGSPYREACLRVLIELPDGLDEVATQAEADRLLTRVAAGATASRPLPILLHGEGSSCWPSLRRALHMGLDTRIGLEDTLLMPDGSVAASNAALVETALSLSMRDDEPRLPSSRSLEAVSGDLYDLERFVEAQANGVHAQALAELRAGRKRSHWMWFVFPQVAGLGLSPTSQHYAIGSLEEARAYLGHPVLGPRLVECAEAVLAHADRTAHEILGSPDDTKLRSSMTLFALADASEPVFQQVLDAFFDGARDPRTAELLGG